MLKRQIAFDNFYDELEGVHGRIASDMDSDSRMSPLHFYPRKYFIIELYEKYSLQLNVQHVAHIKEISDDSGKPARDRTQTRKQSEKTNDFDKGNPRIDADRVHWEKIKDGQVKKK